MLRTILASVWTAVFLAAANIPSEAFAAGADLSGQLGEQIVVQIRTAIDAQQAAWNRGDIDAFITTYDRQAVFVSDDKVTRGSDAILARYKKKYSDRTKMGTLTFSDLEIMPVSENAAFVLGRWSLKRAEDEPHGRFTLIFRKTADGWRIVHDHTSASPPT